MDDRPDTAPGIGGPSSPGAPDLASPAQEAPPSRRGGLGDVLARIILVPLVVLSIALISLLYITHTTARVDGRSMEPTLLPNDILLVTRGYDAPVRGDVIEFEAPPTPGTQEGTHLVKRVIALAGDEVEVVSGHALVNGVPESGNYTVYVASGDIDMPKTTIPDGTVFVLGDNRPISEDSRIFGPVYTGLIRGRVVGIISPLPRIRRVD